MAPMPGLDRRPVRDALGHEGRDPVVDVGAVGRRHLDERAVDLDPADHLAHVDLVATERPRHLGVRLQEEPGPTDERRHVVGIQAQAEVAVAIGRGCGRQHERIGRAVRQDGPHLAEVVGDEIEGSGLERRSGHVRQEVGDVAQPARIGAVQIGPIVQRVHLVHDDVPELIGVLLDGVHERDRLAVGQRQDEIGTVLDVLHHRVGCRCPFHAGDRSDLTRAIVRPQTASGRAGSSSSTMRTTSPSIDST